MFDVVAVLQWVACQVRSWRRKAGGAAPAAWLGPDAAASSSAPAAAASSSVPAAAASSSVPAAEPASSVPAASGEEMSAEEMLQQLDPVVCLALIRR